jgi:peroxiredoxin Q/BCP
MKELLGKPAPLFQAYDQNGKLRKLEEFIGKKIALYFYPKDHTPGCTQEACNLRDNHSILTKNNITVLGISFDDTDSHEKFSKKLELPFILLSDTDHSIAKNYKTTRTFFKSIAPKRITFLIDEKGIITSILDNVDVTNHASQILSNFGINA